MQALKALVIVMAVAILAGIGLVAYTIAVRVTGADKAGFEAIDVAIPEGCTLAESQLERNRIFLRIEGLPERGCQQIIILDAETGEERGRVRLRPAPQSN